MAANSRAGISSVSNAGAKGDFGGGQRSNVAGKSDLGVPGLNSGFGSATARSDRLDSRGLVARDDGMQMSTDNANLGGFMRSGFTPSQIGIAAANKAFGRQPERSISVDISGFAPSRPTNAGTVTSSRTASQSPPTRGGIAQAARAVGQRAAAASPSPAGNIASNAGAGVLGVGMESLNADPSTRGMMQALSGLAGSPEALRAAFSASTNNRPVPDGLRQAQPQAAAPQQETNATPASAPNAQPMPGGMVRSSLGPNFGIVNRMRNALMGETTQPRLGTTTATSYAGPKGLNPNTAGAQSLRGQSLAGIRNRGSQGEMVGAGLNSAAYAAGGSPMLSGRQAARSRQPLGIRANNPGNVLTSSGRGWPGLGRIQDLPGYTGSYNANGLSYATFSTPEYGMQAKRGIINAYMNQGFNTPSRFMDRYAPDDGNNPAHNTYTRAVADALGIGVDDPIPPGSEDIIANALGSFELGVPFDRAYAPRQNNTDDRSELEALLSGQRGGDMDMEDLFGSALSDDEASAILASQQGYSQTQDGAWTNGQQSFDNPIDAVKSLPLQDQIRAAVMFSRGSVAPPQRGERNGGNDWKPGSGIERLVRALTGGNDSKRKGGKSGWTPYTGATRFANWTPFQRALMNG